MTLQKIDIKKLNVSNEVVLNTEKDNRSKSTWPGRTNKQAKNRTERQL